MRSHQSSRFSRLLSIFGKKMEQLVRLPLSIFWIISKTHGKEAWKANGLGGMALAWEDRSRGQRMVEWMGGEKLVQGPCSQDEPNASSWARSAMREAKLGRAKVRVMRSCKYRKRLT